MTALVLSSYTPALGTGRGARTYGLVRALSVHGPVELAYRPFGAAAPDAAYATARGLTLREAGRSPVRSRALAAAGAVLRGAPVPVARGVEPDLAAIAAGTRADRVVAEDVHAMMALMAMPPRSPVIYSANNLESAFRTDWGRRAKVERFERRLFEFAGESWMPSRADLEGARRLAPGASFRYVPNVVDVASIAPVVPAGRSALLVADFSYAPNREAFAWLVGEVLPHLPADVELLVAGRGLDPPPDLDARVHVLGFVDDLRATYARAGCVVVPLRTGGGSPLKFVEALAHGLPVVATPRAAAGLDVVAGEHHLEADEPAAFAAAIDRALGDARLGAAGRALAEAEYSIESLARRIAA